MTVTMLPPEHDVQGGVSVDSGSAAAGIPNVGQGPGVVHVADLPLKLPETAKVSALTFGTVPSNSLLSTIPQVEALMVPLPLMPSFSEEGGPNVYKQPFPPRFAATARAVIVSLLMDRTLMK